MAELDVAKQWKVPRDNTSWFDVVPHGSEAWLRGCGNLPKGDSLSPRQSFASRSSSFTKDVWGKLQHITVIFSSNIPVDMDIESIHNHHLNFPKEHKCL